MAQRRTGTFHMARHAGSYAGASTRVRTRQQDACHKGAQRVAEAHALSDEAGARHRQQAQRNKGLFAPGLRHQLKHAAGVEAGGRKGVGQGRPSWCCHAAGGPPVGRPQAARQTTDPTERASSSHAFRPAQQKPRQLNPTPPPCAPAHEQAAAEQHGTQAAEGLECCGSQLGHQRHRVLAIHQRCVRGREGVLGPVVGER